MNPKEKGEIMKSITAFKGILCPNHNFPSTTIKIIPINGYLAALLLYAKGKLICSICKKIIPGGMGFTYYNRDEHRGYVICNVCKN